MFLSERDKVNPTPCIWADGPGLSPRCCGLFAGFALAVAAGHRGQKLARQLIALAEDRARVLQLPVLELETRVDLEENQAAFRAIGLEEFGRTAHPGYDRPTSITYRCPVAF